MGGTRYHISSTGPQTTFVSHDYVAGRIKGGRIWPPQRIKVVDYPTTTEGRDSFGVRYSFMDRDHTDFVFDSLATSTLDQIFQEPDLLPDERDARLDLTGDLEPDATGL